jgi:hypothetical protein
MAGDDTRHQANITGNLRSRLSGTGCYVVIAPEGYR